jgi:lipoprotein NlpD
MRNYYTVPFRRIIPFRFIIPCSLLILLSIAGCGSRHQPAPVTSLSTTVATPENLTEISGDSYTVQAGDTLFAIAFYSGNDYRDLANINNIRPPYRINIGQQLILKLPAPDKESTTNVDQIKLAQNSSKIDVDQAQPQAYGGTKKETHRKNQNVVDKSSNKPYKSTNKTSLSWIWPAQGLKTVATVGSDGSKRGLDIKGSKGSKVVAAAPGRVVYAGNALKGYGNLIIIKHNDDYLSAYAHNSSILVGEQTYVSQGQQIATMGNSGSSDVMLHFEIRKKGKSVDPLSYLPD